MTQSDTEIVGQLTRKHIKIGRHFLMHRGLLEHVPSRINISKVLVAMVHELKSRIKDDPVEILLFDRGGLEAADHAERFLTHLGEVRSYGFTSELLLEKTLEFSQGSRIIAAIGSEKPFFQKELSTLNASLASLFPDLVDVLLPILLNSTERGVKPFDLLYEEAPGKCRLLEVKARTIKAYLKQHKSISGMDSKNQRRELLQKSIHEGWGLCAFAQNFHESTFNPYEVYSAKITITKSEPDIDLGNEIVRLSLEWLSALPGFSVAEIKNVFLATPYHFIAAQMAAAFIELNGDLKNLIQMKEGVFGWLSGFNMLDMLNLGPLPGLILTFERFPTINLHYVAPKKASAN